MNKLKMLFRWWLEGWKVLIYFAAFYLISSILYGAPVYLWSKSPVGNHHDTALAVLYLGIYLPFATRAAGAYLGRFPVTVRGKKNSIV
jgi:hypothetical protein